MDVSRYYEIKKTYAVGVDVGQAHDPTAVCVVERLHYVRRIGSPLHYVPDAPGRDVFNVRHLERLKLGMTYPAQVSHVCNLLARPGLAEHEPTTWVDYTGVGRAIFDLFREVKVPRMTGVTITSGQQGSTGYLRHNVPKVMLVSRLQALLHSGELKIAAELEDAPVLLRELQEFRVRFTEAGNATWNAREGQHDDLVLALALAVYGAGKGSPVVRVHNVSWPT